MSMELAICVGGSHWGLNEASLCNDEAHLHGTRNAMASRKWCHCSPENDLDVASSFFRYFGFSFVDSLLFCFSFFFCFLRESHRNRERAIRTSTTTTTTKGKKEKKTKPVESGTTSTRSRERTPREREREKRYR